MEATTSAGYEIGTDGKPWGMAPSAIRASRQKNALFILLETFISCLAFLGAPIMSFVATSTKIPPSTPRFSENAPRIESFTGAISDFAAPMANGVRRGIIDLWYQESAIIDIFTGVGFDVPKRFPNCTWSSGIGVSFTIMTG